MAFGGTPGTVARAGCERGAVVLERLVGHMEPGCASRFPCR